jgi:cobalamin biosynthesis protein CobT
MSLSKSALNLIAYSEGLKLKGVLGRLVMRPDSVKKTIDNMVEGSDDVMRLILNDNKMLALFNAAVPEMFGMRVSSPNARRYSQGQQAKTARAKRSQQPEEQALQRVIEAELCGRAVARPNKEAEAMFTRVNEALSQEGFAPVKKGVIRRRLEKKCPLFKNGHKVLPAL